VMMLFSLPYSLLSLGDPPHVTGQATALWLVIALLAVAALSGFRSALRDPGNAPSTSGFLDHYGVTAGAVFLLVFAVLWSAALPDHLAATAGRTPSGTPTGSLVYVIACAAACLGVLALVVLITRKRRPATSGDGQIWTHTGPPPKPVMGAMTGSSGDPRPRRRAQRSAHD
jgi:hypothetical protein